MQRKKKARGGTASRIVRASVSLQGELYDTLVAIARQKRVSTAWVLRDAAERYVADQWPLFAPSRESIHG